MIDNVTEYFADQGASGGQAARTTPRTQQLARRHQVSQITHHLFIEYFNFRFEIKMIACHLIAHLFIEYIITYLKSIQIRDWLSPPSVWLRRRTPSRPTCSPKAVANALTLLSTAITWRARARPTLCLRTRHFDWLLVVDMDWLASTEGEWMGVWCVLSVLQWKDDAAATNRPVQGGRLPNHHQGSTLRLNIM